MSDFYIRVYKACITMRSVSSVCVGYLGEGVFCDVLVGDVRGLDQLAGDLGVCLVKGLPTGACETSKEDSGFYCYRKCYRATTSLS